MSLTESNLHKNVSEAINTGLTYLNTPRDILLNDAIKHKLEQNTKIYLEKLHESSSYLLNQDTDMHPDKVFKTLLRIQKNHDKEVLERYMKEKEDKAND